MKMRWYQEEAVNEFFRAVRDHPKDDLLEVLPTGAGKTIVMANVISNVLGWGGRVIVTARTKELLVQNQDKFCRCFPDLADRTGVYCAGLGLKEYDADVVFASVQSAYAKGELFGPRKLAIIDEAHQIPSGEDTQYQTLLAGLRLTEPTCKLLGLTASPYRLDGGVIFGPGQQFGRVAYNVPLGTLMDEGWITRPKTLDVTKVDLTGVRRTAGDFNKAEVESRFMGRSITGEILAAANDKDAESVLVFASGVAHANMIKDELEAAGECVSIVTGDTPPLFRGVAIDGFTSKTCRWLINVECLTTGFDATGIDMIVVARATESPGLFLQMVGRGFRLHDGKTVCWVLDYGGNIERHGAIDDPTYGINTIKLPSSGGEAPTRVCPSCFEINHASAAKCKKCGLEFPRKPKEFVPSNESIVTEAVTLDVSRVTFERWEGKDGKRDTMRVNYKCEDETQPMGSRRISEWVCFEHDGYARQKAVEWWSEVSAGECPSSINEALETINTIGIAEVESIRVQRQGKYDRVLSKRVGPKPDAVPVDWGIAEDDEIPF